MQNDQPDQQQGQTIQFVDIRTGKVGLDHSKITDPEEIAALKAGTLVFIKMVIKKMREQEKRRKEQEQETANDGAERTGSD